MTKIENIVVEVAQVETTEIEFELTIAELDMVGGGSISIIA